MSPSYLTLYVNKFEQSGDLEVDGELISQRFSLMYLKHREWGVAGVELCLSLSPSHPCKNNVSTVYFILIIIVFHSPALTVSILSFGGAYLQALWVVLHAASEAGVEMLWRDCVHGLTREYEFMKLLAVFCLISKRAWQGILMQFPEHWWNILRISFSSTFVPCKYSSYYLFHCNLLTSHGCTLKS